MPSIEGAALVTGAGRGIGAAVAAAFAAAGAPVALLDRDESVVATAEKLRAGGTETLALVADVADAADVEAAVGRTEAELGPIGVLANVAGVLRTGPLLAAADADLADCLAVNTTGVWNTGRAVGRRMHARRAGSIVTVASNAAAVPRAGMAAYSASKAAALAITRALGLELAPHVRCNAVCPGSTDTPMQRSLWPDPADDRGAVPVIDGSPADYRLGIPLRRIADPADVAAAVLFLASPAARHVTMQSLTVDGGATLGA
ncbi:2,3-dihydro-2,3-dihydroxybenzoate dehydrogenase [Pseudonocardia sp. CNS-139]|nr:2,3-dihydro-2,3-dihydroxybenzoate dehydrogenase [Pseudonocardia sp. CNS-139]